MPALIENTVKVDRVELPASHDCRHIFVQACNQSNVPGPRLRGHSGMGDPKRATFEDARSYKGSEGPGLESARGFGILWSRVREGLEGLVGSKSISNEEDKSFGWCFGSIVPLDSKRVHAMNDGTDEVNVKD